MREVEGELFQEITTVIGRQDESVLFLFERVCEWQKYMRDGEKKRNELYDILGQVKNKLPGIALYIAASKSFVKSQLLAGTRKEVEECIAVLNRVR